jgi:hypothetical protein
MIRRVFPKPGSVPSFSKAGDLVHELRIIVKALMKKQGSREQEAKPAFRTIRPLVKLGHDIIYLNANSNMRPPKSHLTPE